MEREEGEMSDNSMSVDENEIYPSSLQTNSLMDTSEQNNLVTDHLEKVDAKKLEERGKRFGLDLTGNEIVTQKQIEELYTNLGIQSSNKRHFRLDTLCLYGVNGLTTRDIFDYLKNYNPISLEWIDNISCNIVCQDHISAAMALLVDSYEVDRDTLDNIRVDKSYNWRKGRPYCKKDCILMRFATQSDKKIVTKKPKYLAEDYDRATHSINKNPWGDLCRSWGVYDHQEVFHRKFPDNSSDDENESGSRKIKNKQLAKRLGKRSLHTKEPSDGNSDSEWNSKSKMPRMRMHADDEESKCKVKLEKVIDEKPTEKDVFAPLSIELINSQSDSSELITPKSFTKLSDKFKAEKHDKDIKKLNRHKYIKSRLVVKVKSGQDVPSNEEYSSEDSDRVIMSRFKKVINKTKSNVWDRLESTASKSTTQKDLRQVLKSKKQKGQNDLRERISKQKKSNLHIEIRNY